MQKVERGFFQFLQSYWDWLPPEMQQYIMLFAASQHFIDVKNKVKTERRDCTPRQQLRDKIYLYSDLKNAWGLGHIRVQVTKKQCGCTCEYCIKTLKITGYYRDFYELTKQNVYLGHSYSHAKSRMNHVKSFL